MNYKKLAVLKKYKDLFEKALKEHLQTVKEKTKLKEAYEYSLTTGGKRFRPIIVLLIAEILNKKFEAMPAALSVEFFHTASLIADDLPCMDNEETRRCKPALHLVFEESVSLLVSYALISAGYEMIYKNTQALIDQKLLEKDKANELCVKALEEISKMAGIDGVNNGQFLDLFPPDFSEKTIFKIIEQKTVSLFQVSFILGWLFGGGDPYLLDHVKKAAHHFGMAFQIADDLSDLVQDIKNNNKINVGIALGEEKAKFLFINELDLFQKKMKELKLYNETFEEICCLLSKVIKE